MNASERDAYNKKVDVIIMNLLTEIDRTTSENRDYPLIVGAIATLAIIAVVKLFL